MSHVLKQKGHTTTVIYPTVFAENFNYLRGATDAIIGKEQFDKATTLISEAEVIFCMDFNEPKRLEMLEQAILDAKGFKILVDHHLNPADFVDVCFSVPEISATSLLLFELLQALGWEQYIDKHAAEAIYTGLMTDTGGFSYNSEDPAIYTTISTLLEHGIEKDKISNCINRSFSIDKIKLNAYILHNNLTFFPQYRAAIMKLSMKEKQMYNYQVGDTEGLVNEPLAAKDIDLSIFLHEMGRYTKISLRSKGTFPTNEFAAKFFNGGGHINASGAEVFARINDVYKMVVEAIQLMHPKAEEE